jgi:hypothetical protein
VALEKGAIPTEVGVFSVSMGIVLWRSQEGRTGARA